MIRMDKSVRQIWVNAVRAVNIVCFVCVWL